MIVDLFIPCFIDQVMPQVGMSVVKIFDRLEVGVHYNTEQTCCGQMAFNSGFWNEARCVGEKFIRDFNNNRPVVGPSASCVGYVKNFYSEMFKNSSLHNELKQLNKNIYEFSDFLVNVLNVTDVGARLDARATYHDACAALREYGIKDEPRKLLNNVRGLTLIEMEDNDVCCGFGGTFSVKFEAISTAMAEQKVHFAVETGADFIISTEASCLMHIDAYIKKHKLPVKTLHLAEVLATGW